MAAPPADPVAAARRQSMAPSVAAAVVPPGAAPVVPAFVPRAQDYEDDEDEVEDIMRPKPAQMQQMGASGPSLGLIFGVALVVITLSAVVTFYALGKDKEATPSGPPSSSASTPFPPLVLVPDNKSLLAEDRDAGVAEYEGSSSGPGDDACASPTPETN
ncbi:uncharacterized protein LOC144134883 [Amblyomma americanum]